MTTIVDVDPERPDRQALQAPAAALRDGRLVAFPTETVYGLGAHAADPEAIAAVFAAKDRPAGNPLIVHVPDLAGAAAVAAITDLAGALAEAFWPGPLTLVLEATPAVPSVTTGGLTTVAVRAPAHPVARALLEVAAVPVAAPSANSSGRPSPTRAAHVLADLEGRVDVVVDGGACPLGVESTVVDARGVTPVVLREGTVTREDLVAVAGVTESATAGAEAASPGTRFAHYVPDCAVEIARAGQGRERAAALAASGCRVGLVAPQPAPPGVVEIARPSDAAALAQTLYAALREAERQRLQVVVVEAVDDRGVGRAVMDRLRRAAAG